MRIIDDAFDMHGGYVLDFSNRTFAEFFDDEFRINIYDPKYSFNGRSKARYLRAFVKVEDGFIVAKVLRRLWEYRESVGAGDLATREAMKVRLFSLVAKIEGGGAAPRTDAIDRFKADETLDELIAAIERDVNANRPGAALDRLHLYEEVRALLDERGIAWDKAEPLHSRVGKYAKALAQERQLHDVTAQIVRSSTAIFEKFNHVRNNQSLAHDNRLLNPAEARYVYDAITALLRFVKTVEAGRFGA